MHADTFALRTAAEGVRPANGLEPDAVFAPRLDQVALQATYLPAGCALFRILLLCHWTVCTHVAIISARSEFVGELFLRPRARFTAGLFP